MTKTRSTPSPALVLAAAALLLAPAAMADDPEMTWHTIDAGGVFDSSYASLTMSATIGQADVGAMYGGDLALAGGFWVVLEDNGYCIADWDGNGEVTPADVAAFINAWVFDLANGTLLTDLSGSGTIEPLDVALFVNAWTNALNGIGC